jgi:hypothetical protein
MTFVIWNLFGFLVCVLVIFEIEHADDQALFASMLCVFMMWLHMVVSHSDKGKDDE